MSVWLKKEEMKVGHIARVVLPGSPVGVLVRVVEQTAPDQFVGRRRDGSTQSFGRDQVYLACEGLTLRDWQDAEFAQGACNGGAVVHAFSRTVQRLQAESEFFGLGTAWIHRHPIFRAYLNQLTWLARDSSADMLDVLQTVNRVCETGEGVHHRIETKQPVEA